MIIDRAEFHRRQALEEMDAERKPEELPVAMLLKECKKDAPFRNHQYMFRRGVDFSKLPIQESTVGILKAHPRLKTEAQRFKYVREELLRGTYEPVPISRDKDHPSIINVDEGFHRIYLANELGWKTIKCNVRYGKFPLDDTISLSDLKKLLIMCKQLWTTAEKPDPKLSEMINGLTNWEKNHKNFHHTSFTYNTAYIKGKEPKRKKIYAVKTVKQNIVPKRMIK